MCLVHVLQDQNTALHLSSMNGHTAIVVALHEREADINSKNLVSLHCNVVFILCTYMYNPNIDGTNMGLIYFMYDKNMYM